MSVNGRVNQSTDLSQLNITSNLIVLDKSAAVDLYAATIRIETAFGHESMVYREEREAFGIDPLVDPDRSALTLYQAADRFAVDLETPSLPEGDFVRVSIAFDSGATKIDPYRFPTPLPSGGTIAL